MDKLFFPVSLGRIPNADTEVFILFSLIDLNEKIYLYFGNNSQCYYILELPYIDSIKC